MAPTESRRKSGSKGDGLVVTLSVPASQLRDIFPDQPAKEETPDETKPAVDAKDSPAPSAAPPASNGEAASDSNAATPAADGTPSAMGPPEGKKKGVKRSAGAANGNVDGVPKPRGKPGPKKKPRLEDGTIDHAAVRQAAANKLGPRANQGAINAGLRALDRSGKPCRKWAKGGFTLKSFTGVVWEVPRWTAPPKPKEDDGEDESGANSADGSNKENKENGLEANSANNSNVDGDAEMQSVPSIKASSPAPPAVAAS